MTATYLILAHANPGHLARLVKALAASTHTSGIYIHLDQKTAAAPFQQGLAGILLKNGQRPQLLDTRYAIHWGAWNTVEATFALMRAALDRPLSADRPDYLVLLSGADFPLQSADYIGETLENAWPTEFVNLVEMPCPRAQKMLNRVESYAPDPSRPASRVLRRLHRLLQRLRLAPARRNYRKAFGSLQPYAGSTWWAITSECARHVLQEAQAHPALLRFLRDAPCVDETCVPTLIGNSRFRDRVARNLTYTDWSARKASPEILGESYLERFREPVLAPPDDVYGPGELLFARKFEDASASVVERLGALNEAKLRQRTRTPPTV